MEIMIMHTFISTELDEIKEEAQNLVDYFWYEMKYYSQGNNFGFLGLRLRKREGGISLEWYNVFYNKHSKNRNKNYIKKGKSDSYNLDKIKKHKHRRDYEINLIDELEPRCAHLRKRAKALSRISLALKKYEKV